MNIFLTPQQRHRGVSLSFLLCALCSLFFSPNARAASAFDLGGPSTNQAASWPLAIEAKVDGRGIFLRNVIAANFTQPLPDVRIADAPAFGRYAIYTRAQLNDLLAKTAPELIPVWSGPERIRVVRRARMMDETEIRQMLTTTLQNEQVRERGELEIRFVRPWAPVLVPDEALALRVIDLPNTGISGNFIVRCEMKAGDEIVGNWQINVNAKIWREVWVARSAVLRGQPLAAADIGQERRDLLSFKEGLTALPSDINSYDVAENLTGGSILTGRSIKQRPIVKRGKTLDALVQDGPLQILVKVEALEDGLPGQFVRVRNIKSRREFRGKVENEETILVNL
jgi:flagella basal body P-ring formation protein FlgA